MHVRVCVCVCRCETAQIVCYVACLRCFVAVLIRVELTLSMLTFLSHKRYDCLTASVTDRQTDRHRDRDRVGNIIEENCSMLSVVEMH